MGQLTTTQKLKQAVAYAFVQQIDEEPDFHRLMSEATSAHGVSEAEIANDLGFSRSSINRWTNGRSKPHPLLMKAVRAYIKDRVEKTITHPDIAAALCVEAVLLTNTSAVAQPPPTRGEVERWGREMNEMARAMWDELHRDQDDPAGRDDG